MWQRLVVTDVLGHLMVSSSNVKIEPWRWKKQVVVKQW